MRTVILIAASFVGISMSACSGNPVASTATAPAIASPVVQPIAAANLSASSFDVPGCQALLQLSASLGLHTASCPRFSGTMRNIGSGCASAIRGTTVIWNSSATQTGSGSWTYAQMVRPGEQFIYSGSAITLPSNGLYTYHTTPFWDNVRCQ